MNYVTRSEAVSVGRSGARHGFSRLMMRAGHQLDIDERQLAAGVIFRHLAVPLLDQPQVDHARIRLERVGLLLNRLGSRLGQHLGLVGVRLRELHRRVTLTTGLNVLLVTFLNRLLRLLIGRHLLVDGCVEVFAEAKASDSDSLDLQSFLKPLILAFEKVRDGLVELCLHLVLDFIALGHEILGAVSAEDFIERLQDMLVERHSLHGGEVADLRAQQRRQVGNRIRSITAISVVTGCMILVAALATETCFIGH